MTKLPPGLSYEGKVEHIIELIVLNTIPPDCASAADTRAAIREFCKAVLRLNELELPSDAVIDEIASEMIEWHAPRPDEPGWNPDLAEAPAELRLMDWNRRRADIAVARAGEAAKVIEGTAEPAALPALEASIGAGLEPKNRPMPPGRHPARR
jgi:hypothetical protein